MIKVLSLGAGVQSSTLALMAEHGEVDKPDLAVFADTQWEPKAVYDWLDWLKSKLSYPVVVVSEGNLIEDFLDETRKNFVAIPFHLTGSGLMGRQCTANYKIKPIRGFLRTKYGKKETFEMLIGISTDEFLRCKEANVKYLKHRWPLIEKDMSRQDCIDWMAKHDYPTPPRSSCLGCPFHSDEEWRRIKDGPVDEWEATCRIDERIRKMPRFDKQVYMHRSLKPLRDVDLRTMEEMGQLTFTDWVGECEGMCGV